MDFKVGQIVTLKKGELTRGYNAKPGDRARVTGMCNAYPNLVGLVWLDGVKQGNGGYEPSDFCLVSEQDGQLLFSFME